MQKVRVLYTETLMQFLTANTVSIDNHKMWIYAADGQMVVPQQVDAVNIPLGNRFQAFVKYVFLLGQEHQGAAYDIC